MVKVRRAGCGVRRAVRGAAQSAGSEVRPHAPRTRHVALGTSHLARRTWHVALGTVALGTSHLARRTRHVALGTAPRTWPLALRTALRTPHPALVHPYTRSVWHPSNGQWWLLVLVALLLVAVW